MENIHDIKEIIRVMRSQTPDDIEKVRRAYDFAQKAHEGQKRYSGEPYFSHVANVAFTLADMGLDTATICAGLLHDTVEDAHTDADTLEKEFGLDVRTLVDGVTKLGKLKYRGLERHVESLRKLFVSTAKDIRVIIIKLADRLHNVSTLEHVPKEKRKRIALETLEIYAPIANRLSIGLIKGQLEDYSFPYAFPEEYQKVEKIIREYTKGSQKRLEKIYREIRSELAKSGINATRGEHRVKRTYSLFKKLQRNGMDIAKIYDIIAIRVVVPTVSDCYAALGVIHSVRRPLPGRIKDYIAFPKPNGYQSLHTTVFTGDGGFVEIQIRTPEMDRDAEYGVAAHFVYKETGKGTTKPTKKIDWVNELSAIHQSISETGEYLTNLKTDFFEDRVFVFTPRGDVIDLPVMASPIDFAYAIHSHIGDHIFGARVNGKMVSLDTALDNGDIVEIITKKSAKPSNKWLEYAKTVAAKKHVRAFLQEEAEKRARESR